MRCFNKKDLFNIVNKRRIFVKRLKKKANSELNYEIELALVDLVFSNDGSNLIELYNEIDQDCFYNGEVYKILYLDDRKLIKDLQVKKDEMGIYVKCKDLINSIYENVTVGDWTSTSKQYENLDLIGLDITVNNPISVVIKFNCKNGIDLNKLSKRCLENFNNENIDSYNEELNALIEITDQQNEVFAKMSKDYEILSISDVDINEFSGTVNILNLELE